MLRTMLVPVISPIMKDTSFCNIVWGGDNSTITKGLVTNYKRGGGWLQTAGGGGGN